MIRLLIAIVQTVIFIEKWTWMSSNVNYNKNEACANFPLLNEVLTLFMQWMTWYIATTHFNSTQSFERTAKRKNESAFSKKMT